MVKRKKRLEKGIKSLEYQKRIHELKRKKADEAGDEELVGYYSKEIGKFEREIQKKEEKI
jgi:hypothetical protein